MGTQLPRRPTTPQCCPRRRPALDTVPRAIRIGFGGPEVRDRLEGATVAVELRPVSHCRHDPLRGVALLRRTLSRIARLVTQTHARTQGLVPEHLGAGDRECSATRPRASDKRPTARRFLSGPLNAIGCGSYLCRGAHTPNGRAGSVNAPSALTSPLPRFHSGH